MPSAGSSLRVAGLGIISLLVAILGLAFAGVGIALAVVDGDVLGGMIGLFLAVATVVVAVLMNDI